MSRRGHDARPLRIRELAVDPADVDRDRYPVRIRLSRTLTETEVRALASLDAGVRADGDALVVPDANLDDIAHAQAEWSSRLETVERLGEELLGEGQVADQRREQERQVSGSHLGDRHDPYFMS